MSEKQCENPCMFRYTWPGKDESYICLEHAQQLTNVANAIGLHLQRLVRGGAQGVGEMSKIQLCWQCNKRLSATFAEIKFNGSTIAVHKVCEEDARNLLFKNRVTFHGEERRDDE